MASRQQYSGSPGAARSGRGPRASTCGWRAGSRSWRSSTPPSSAGELSYAKVRALTRVATAENEEELLALARVFTAAQLERAVRAYRRVSTGEARELQEGAYLSVFWEADGSLAIHGRLAPEDGALFLRALDAMRDALWKEGRGSAEPRPSRQASNAEALVAVADAAPHPGESRTVGERHQVVVHLAREPSPTTAREAASSTTGSPSLRRRRADSPATRPSSEAAAKTRTIPPALQRALRGRDPAAAFQAARTAASSMRTTSTTGPEAGPTTLGNLVLLCRRHHRLVHEGGWHVDRRMRVLLPTRTARPGGATPVARAPRRAGRAQPRPRYPRRHLRAGRR